MSVTMANSGASIFEYYRDIIPEQENWTAVCSQPLPRCFWANTLKTTPLQLKKLLEADGFSLQPVAWDPTAFRTLQTDVGKQWHYSAGLLQIQEEVSMLPVHFLDPKPGERVLDLCAAPGNKTAQIAIRLNNTGTLIANDKNFQRMRAFGQISKRLGLLNVSTTVYDGRNYPRLLNYFDKVLVDAPCSGEGVFRKGKGRDIVPNKKNSLRLQRIQIDLLKKAIQLCRPGGRIVYSTCTFSPLENEAVLDAILKTHDNIQLKPVRLDHFQLTPAITQWQGKTFDDGVVNAGRAWPHLNNSGGFFVAVLEKQGELIEVDDSLPPKSIASDKDQLQAIIGEQVERFGFPDTLFESYVYNDDNYRGIYCVNADNQPPSELKIDATG
ncbi:MAG: RsmB/NOP family class I SAM-dependent RNA methyltransferase, partial [Coxiellaceae bacterium]|nr:RsmB/NOP family class I SAM-dependent RNA methyltransferase [Coxiellaceae bacterium]